MELKIKTLTPIWTGDVKRKSTKLRETSIIGSLRWWFEAIVRGLGGYACDGMNNKCEYKDDLSSLCPVCQIFGTTGRSRRFRLEIDENSYQSVHSNLAIGGLNCNHSPNSGSVRWWLNKTLGKLNPIVIKEKTNNGISLNLTTDNFASEGVIYIALKTIEKFGALGSHNSYGFGIVKVLEPTNVDIDKTLDFIKRYCEKWKSNEENLELPNLKHAFKIDFRLSRKLHNKNIGFLMKYTLRNKFKKEYDKDFAEQLFGSKKDRSDKFSGKIFASNCWEKGGESFLRVYGMLPPTILGDRKREDILNTIEKCISECLDAERFSEVSFDLGENEYLNTDMLKKLVMKDEA